MILRILIKRLKCLRANGVLADDASLDLLEQVIHLGEDHALQTFGGRDVGSWDQELALLSRKAIDYPNGSPGQGA
jgi:hypothetical protein